MGSTPVRQRVGPAELRRRFNDGNYWRRAQAGEFTQRVKRDGTPATSTEPPGTRSQIVAFYDSGGRRVALVHWYLRPDGSLGGSGMPDPKELFEGGILCYV
jgi:hypothetical protein